MNIQRILFSGLLMATMAIPCADLIARGRPGGGGGGGRPSGGGGSRPSMSRPSPSRSPSSRSPSMSRPSTSRPSVSRPSPSRPSTRPSTPNNFRPSTPSRPTTRPTTPSTRPSVPSTRPTNPSVRPGTPSTRPTIPSTRPGTRPGFPSTRPGTGPSTRPSAPSRNDLQDFLKLPAAGVGAGIGSGIADRKADPAGGLRDKMKDNPKFQDKMQDIKQNGPGDKAGLKDQISQLPADRERPNRGDVQDRISDRGTDLRNHVNDHRPFPGHLPHYPHHPHWGHGHGNWWRWASAGALTRWCVWGPRWGQPVYYDYGSTVYYDMEYVYVNDEPYATTEQYAEQAMELADSGAQALAAAPEVEESGTDENWMSLGVFALANSDQGDPIMYLQMAVDNQGTIAGTYYNSATKTSLPVSGKVDSETQRAAWTIGDNKQTVMETGIYNLTEDQTSVMVHFRKEKQQTWMMARLDEESEEGSDAPASTLIPPVPATNS